jgi:hypothetical protein
VTLAAGAILGACGFGGNEFLRRFLTGLGGAQARGRPSVSVSNALPLILLWPSESQAQELYALQISVLAALFAQLVAATAVAPLELLRLRAVSATIDASLVEGEGGGTAAAAEAEARWALPRGLRELYSEGGACRRRARNPRPGPRRPRGLRGGASARAAR